MPALKHHTRAQSSRSPRQYKNRTWNTGALVQSLHLRAHGTQNNTAARQAHISNSTLARYWKEMPIALQNGGTQTAIIEWYQQHESHSLDEHPHTLLTHMEEELLCDWCILAHQHFEPVGKEQITDKAREIVRASGREEHTGTVTVT